MKVLRLIGSELRTQRSFSLRKALDFGRQLRQLPQRQFIVPLFGEKPAILAAELLEKLIAFLDEGDEFRKHALARRAGQGCL